MNALVIDSAATVVIKQHLIDPEVCIRCNTCEETCPVKAITHDSRNYVVNADICNACNACISPCPTGSIDHWRTVAKVQAYTLEEQLGWDELPAEKPLPVGVAADCGATVGETDTAAFSCGGAPSAPTSVASESSEVVAPASSVVGNSSQPSCSSSVNTLARATTRQWSMLPVGHGLRHAPQALQTSASTT